MKVRTKFTLWLALTSFFAAFLFSVLALVEIFEEPERLVQRELLDTGEAILNSVEYGQTPTFSHKNTDYPLHRYWIKLKGSDENLIYASPLTSSVHIEPNLDESFYTTIIDISPRQVWIDPLDDDELDELVEDTVRFGVQIMTSSNRDEKLTLVIAKPMALLYHELRELLRELFSYILLTSLVILLISYYLAGKMLAPLTRINEKIQDIRQNSLNERIPLSTSKDELYTLSVSLNSMFDRLHHSFQQQKEFIANASHEMKSPLTILMLGHEEMLAGDIPENVESELQKQLTTLRRLNKLVKDLLDISILEHQEFIELHTVSLTRIIEQVLDDFGEIVKAKNITCSFEIEELKVSGDYDKLMRVFINLIDNGIKYNLDTNGSIVIRVKKENTFARISITNSGENIPAEDITHIFKQFYRVEKSRSIKYGGTGLGLTIVKRIIDLHNGEIWVESKEGNTTFTFTLPLSSLK